MSVVQLSEKENKNLKEKKSFWIFSNQVTTKIDIFMELKFFPWFIVTNFNHPWKFSSVKSDETLGKRRK